MRSEMLMGTDDNNGWERRTQKKHWDVRVGGQRKEVGCILDVP